MFLDEQNTRLNRKLLRINNLDSLNYIASMLPCLIWTKPAKNDRIKFRQLAKYHLHGHGSVSSGRSRYWKLLPRLKTMTLRWYSIQLAGFPHVSTGPDHFIYQKQLGSDDRPAYHNYISFMCLLVRIKFKICNRVDIPRVYDLSLHWVVIKDPFHVRIYRFSGMMIQTHDVTSVMFTLEYNINND